MIFVVQKTIEKQKLVVLLANVLLAKSTASLCATIAVIYIEKEICFVLFFINSMRSLCKCDNLRIFSINIIL